MKASLLKILAFVLVFVAVISLAACGDLTEPMVETEQTKPETGDQGKEDNTPAAHVHTYSEEWSMDNENHWHEATCSDNDSCETAISGFAAHDFSAGNCVCGAEKQPEPQPHEHTYSVTLTYDENGHWYAATCSDNDSCASAKKDFAAHSLDINEECECGYAAEHTHKFGETVAFDETGHWFEAICDKDSSCVFAQKDFAAHEFNQNNECACGYAGEHVHKFATTLTYDENGHWYAAICDKDESCAAATKNYAAHELNVNDVCDCGYEAAHTHKFGNGIAYDENGHWNTAICNKDASCAAAKNNYAAHELDVNDICDCTYEAEHTHKFGNEIAYDETGHWYVAICNKDEFCATNKGSFAAHELDVNDVCACGYAAEHTHKFGNELVHDANGHWYVAICTKNAECATATSGYAAHDFSAGNCVCGQEKPHEHTFANVYTYDESGHWYAATCNATAECATLKTGFEAHTLDANETCACGYAGQHVHKYATELTYDENGHWYAATCTKDETCATAKKDYAAHSLNVNDVCACGYAAEHTHKYAAELTYDAEGHYYASTCSKDASCASAKKDFAAHSLNVNDECSCGYAAAHTHKFAAELTSDANGHWYASICSKNAECATATSGYAAHDFSAGNCACGAVKPHEHTFAETYTYDETNHWYASTCSGTNECATLKAEVAPHEFDENGACQCGYEQPYRAKGEYVGAGLNYSGVTATYLKEINTLWGTVNFDSATKPALNVTSVGGDNALTFTSQSSGNYFVVGMMDYSGSNVVFETDFLIESSSDSWGTNGEILGMYAITGTNTSFWGFGDIRFASERIKDEGGSIIGHKYFIYTSNGTGLKYEIEGDKWYNLAIEREDLTVADGNINIYLNGEKIYTFTHSATTTALTGMKITAKSSSQNVAIHFDNTYFGSTKDSWGNRGSGLYADEALNFNATTATKLGESGTLSIYGDASLDGTTLPATVSALQGNNALKLANNAWAKQGYVNVAASSLSNSMVFEVDLLFASMASDPSSTRGDLAIFQFTQGGSASASVWAWSGGLSIVVDKTDENNFTYFIKTGKGTLHQINFDEWNTLRVEFTNITAKGSDINYYINGELLCTEALNSATSTGNVDYLRIWMPGNSGGELYLDNLYYGSAE